jgi:hypothetical protein
MASRYGVDRIFFSALRNWNTFDQQEYAQRAVHLAAHPDHAMFVKSLTDARLQRPEVTLGELSA